MTISAQQTIMRKADGEPHNRRSGCHLLNLQTNLSLPGGAGPDRTRLLTGGARMHPLWSSLAQTQSLNSHQVFTSDF